MEISKESFLKIKFTGESKDKLFVHINEDDSLSLNISSINFSTNLKELDNIVSYIKEEIKNRNQIKSLEYNYFIDLLNVHKNGEYKFNLILNKSIKIDLYLLHKKEYNGNFYYDSWTLNFVESDLIKYFNFSQIKFLKKINLKTKIELIKYLSSDFLKDLKYFDYK